MNRRDRAEQRRSATAVIERNAPAVLTAAAVSVKFNQGVMGTLRLGGTEWQQEGWQHYDSCSEFHSGVSVFATKLSRASLYGVDIDPVTGKPKDSATDDPDVVDIMRELFGGATGQSQALDRLARHLIVAGDGWCLASATPEMDAARWEILSTSEVTGGAGGKIMVTDLNGNPRELDQRHELLFRMWRPHPKRRYEADAMTRSLLPVLRELSALTAMVSATVKSRLASSGILWIPDDITLPQPLVNAAEDSVAAAADSMNAAGWLDLITEAMTAPIRDPDSASAVVPLVAIVKGTSIAQIQHMEFGRDLDAEIEPLRQACIRRLAVGMDLPPEILLGLAAANHWTAWTITEEFAKSYLAPLLELICDALTVFFLRPAMRSRGRDPEDFAVGFSLDDLFPEQITVDNAKSAYEAGLLSEERFLQALGFGPDDMASPAQRGRHLIEEMVKRGVAQTVAELAPALKLLYPGLVIDTAPVTPLPSARAIGPGTSTPSSTGTEPTPTPTAPSTPAPPTTSPTPPAGGTP